MIAPAAGRASAAFPAAAQGQAGRNSRPHGVKIAAGALFPYWTAPLPLASSAFGR